MAFSSAISAAYPNSFSIGPLKVEIHNYSVASGDTTGTVTATHLTTVIHAHVAGVAGVATAAPTYATNVATLAFVNPAATRYGQIILFGK